MKHPEHFCSRNDGDCICTCYAEGFAKGVEMAKECAPKKTSLPFDFESHTDYEIGSYVGKEIGYLEATKEYLAALNELTDKS